VHRTATLAGNEIVHLDYASSIAPRREFGVPLVWATLRPADRVGVDGDDLDAEAFCLAAQRALLGVDRLLAHADSRACGLGRRGPHASQGSHQLSALTGCCGTSRIRARLRDSVLPGPGRRDAYERRGGDDGHGSAYNAGHGNSGGSGGGNASGHVK